jgi:hypothetical protein
VGLEVILLVQHRAVVIVANARTESKIERMTSVLHEGVG